MGLTIFYNGNEYGEFKVKNNKLIIADEEFDMVQKDSLLWVFGFDKEYNPKKEESLDFLGRIKYLRNVGYFLLDGSDECNDRLMALFETADKFFAYIGKNNFFANEPSYEIIDGEIFHYLKIDYQSGYHIGDNIFYVRPDNEDEDHACHDNLKLTKMSIDENGNKQFAKILTGRLGIYEDDERFHYEFETNMDGYDVSFYPPRTSLINTNVLNPKQFGQIKVRDAILTRMQRGICTEIKYYPENM